MTPTEELRKGLDELGVKWWKANPCKTKWYSPVLGSVVAVMERNGELWLVADYESVSPAQVITATVGNRTDLSKRLREVSGLHAFAELFGFDWKDDSDWTWHDVACAMADAVDAATVGAGTCKRVPYDPSMVPSGMYGVVDYFAKVCDHCGHKLGQNDRYSGGCGRRIEVSE